MDLQSVKTKLIYTVDGLNQSDIPVQVDWHPDSLRGESEGRSPAEVKFSAAVEALQWRSVAGGEAGAVAPDVYTKRLRAMASKINHLSAEQERAIAEMQGILSQLRRLPGAEQTPGSLPRLDLRRLNLAAAEVDAQGNIAVLSRPVVVGNHPPSRGSGRPPSPQTACLSGQRINASATSPARSSGWLGMLAEAIALGQEPWQIVRAMGQWVWQVVLVCGKAAGAALGGRTSPIRPALEHWPMLSPVDGCLWFGGGVIGRLALNLLLVAFPSLWSVAVAGVTAITAYALYRATLAPKLAFGPALRVALLVLGLLVGGQL